jgi:hypothetical protein
MVVQLFEREVEVGLGRSSSFYVVERGLLHEQAHGHDCRQTPFLGQPRSYDVARTQSELRRPTVLSQLERARLSQIVQEFDQRVEFKVSE